MNCPKCGLINPETALTCDCGYGFQFNLPALKELQDIPEKVRVKGLRWLIDLPRPRQVKEKKSQAGQGAGVLLGLFGLLFFFFRLPGKEAILGLVAIVVALFLSQIPDKSNKLLASGNVTFGKILKAEWEGNVEAELGWRLDYKFADSKGAVHTAAYEYADEEEWQGKVGDVLPVFYDNSNPSRNYLLLDLDRIVRPMPSRESS